MINPKLDILIDCLLFHSKIDQNDPTRDPFEKPYMPLV